MKKCSSCNIEFNTSERYCPLCQNKLNGSVKEVMYPKNIRLQTNSIILKIVLFFSITILLTIGFIEMMMTNNLSLTYYIGLGLITNYIIIRIILKSYLNFFRIIARYGFIIIVLLLIWYFVTKFNVITNYIIPIVCIVELIFNSIVGIIVRKNYVVKYSGQIMMNLFLSIFPIALVYLNFTTNNMMSYICCLLSVITFIGLLIFYYDDIKEELIKIFNL